MFDVRLKSWDEVYEDLESRPSSTEMPNYYIVQ